jgi:hypothetical protein
MSWIGRSVLLATAIAVLLPAHTPAAQAVGLDCSDFQSQDSAQHYFDDHKDDLNNLDADHDGTPCETSPHAANYALGGAIGGSVAGSIAFTSWEQRRKGKGWTPAAYGNVAAGVMLFTIPGMVAGLGAARYLRDVTPLLCIPFAIVGSDTAIGACWAYHRNR